MGIHSPLETGFITFLAIYRHVMRSGILKNLPLVTNIEQSPDFRKRKKPIFRKRNYPVKKIFYFCMFII